MSTSFKTTQPAFDPEKEWDGYVDIDSVIPDPDQPRTYFNRDKINDLAKSIGKNGQQVAIRVRQIKRPGNPKVAWQIIGGDRRHRAARQIGLKQVKITYSPATRPQSHRAALIDNCCREDMTLGDKARAIKLEIEGGASAKELAEDLGWTEAYVNQLLQINNLEPSLFALLSAPTPKEDRISINTALKICNREHETQLRVYKIASRDRTKTKAAVNQAITVELAKIDNLPVVHGLAHVPGSTRQKKQGDVVKYMRHRLMTMRDASELLFEYANACDPARVTDPARAEMKELIQTIVLELGKTATHLGISFK
ncbi:MAG: ParB family transcriptional regulator, chromosome partitioning protein [Patescibacteria group bacterium]|jgi:ParB/RepB/Spo0J family partition protein|nr:ParB family transcriptional regulator, chromosome partitioning protein [Patescibacteria group bacterium]